MAVRQVNIRFEAGSFQQGFSVALTILDDHYNPLLVTQGFLPQNLALLQTYQEWRQSYLQWGGATRIDPIDDRQLNVSYLEATVQASQTLKQQLNQWLESDSFLPLKQKLYQELSPEHEAICILQTSDLKLQRLPWSCWHLFEDFPLLNWGLAPTSYQMLKTQPPPPNKRAVNVLAVLAGDETLDTSVDQALIENLDQTQVTTLHQPTRQALTDYLWQKPWDILFFAGHSSSASGQGEFTIAQDHWMATSAIQYALQTSARQGLTLAIFNSCDGLAIAQELVQQHIPFIITMREPVPDPVAQTFLEYFLQAYCQGQSLFQAFNEAHKRLESLEDMCPNATWLPVLICNPVVSPPTWQDLRGPLAEIPEEKRLGFTRLQGSLFFRPPSLKRSNLLTLLATLCLLFVIRSVGMLQGAELWAFDQLMQRRLPEQYDARILLVEIDEAYIQQQNAGYGSISDQELHRAIQNLSRAQPRMIGLDIYRDQDALDPDLAHSFANNERLISVCKSPEVNLDSLGVPAPIGLPLERQGFSDVLEDPDGVVRRQILFMTPPPDRTCATKLSFSSQLAIQYLQAQGVQPQFSKHRKPIHQNLILSSTHFWPIRQFWGGYQRINLGGNQIMLNYRALKNFRDIAPSVNIEDVLQGRVRDSVIRDRIVMIGVTANTTADLWETPYAAVENHRVPGLFLQAQMVSQILSAVLDQRPLISVWPRGVEWLWICLWTSLGYLLPHPSLKRWGSFTALSLGLSFMALLAFKVGLWLPTIPCMLGLLVTTIEGSKPVQQSNRES